MSTNPQIHQREVLAKLFTMTATVESLQNLVTSLGWSVLASRPTSLLLKQEQTGNIYEFKHDGTLTHLFPNFSENVRGQIRMDQLNDLEKEKHDQYNKDLLNSAVQGINNARANPILRDFSQEDTAKVFAEFISKIMELRNAGHREYAHGPSFGNFNRLSQRLKLPRGKVLWTYLEKHLDGIVSHLNGHELQREPVEGRIFDAVVYLLLLAAMLEEDRRNNVNRTTKFAS